MTELGNEQVHLYLRVYNYYKELIITGKLKTGKRLPSVRRCSQELNISRTTAATAYMMLAADGYVISKPQSGYYVTDVSSLISVSKADVYKPVHAADGKAELKADFSASMLDKDSFNFDIWRRYIRSALRQDERLLSYGEPQGEYDLRLMLAEYIYKSRNIICSPDDIVIGAGVQSLLQIICPLLKDRKTVSFPTPSFTRGSQIFSDYGYEVHYRDKNAGVIYVSPSHMTQWGEVMSVSRRLELIKYASERDSIIIEDDYESEFLYMHKPVPSLQSLAGQKGVIYMGTFSRLLLPSIRISYMVLPSDILNQYKARAFHYNQTASKTEQIALCQFIRDGSFETHVRRLRRLYDMKTKKICEIMKKLLKKNNVDITAEEGSLCVILTVKSEKKPDSIYKYPRKDEECIRITEEAGKIGIVFNAVLREKGGNIKIVLSSIGTDMEKIEESCNYIVSFFKQYKFVLEC